MSYISIIGTSTIIGQQEQTTQQSFGYIFAYKDLIHFYSEIAPCMWKILLQNKNITYLSVYRNTVKHTLKQDTIEDPE